MLWFKGIYLRFPFLFTLRKDTRIHTITKNGIFELVVALETVFHEFVARFRGKMGFGFHIAEGGEFCAKI